VKSLHLFSSNEDLEDISTKNLRFLLIEFYLGELFLKIVDSYRLRNLKESKNYFISFLNKCEKFNLINQEDLDSLHREFPLDPQATRKEKISRFKREKEVSQRFHELVKKRAEARKKERGSISSHHEEEEEEEEETRELIRTLIEMSIQKATDSLEMTQKECTMLEQIEKMKIENGGNIPKPTPEPDPFIQTFTIPTQLTQRETINSRVFLPGYPTHTLTPEQWADQQMKLGLLPTQTNNNVSNEKKKEDEDEKENEEATLKSRTWDDWKDENTRGSGNKNDKYFKRT